MTDQQQSPTAEDGASPKDGQGMTGSNNITPRDAAVALAAQGFKMIPLHTPDVLTKSCSCGKDPCNDIGKHPRTKYLKGDNTALWEQRATSDVDIVEMLWNKWPAANVGWATGDGLMHVDLDWGEDPVTGDVINGEEELYIACHKAGIGDLPPTRTLITGSGGTHLLFRVPAGVKAPTKTSVLPCVDVRGDGGLAVGPPSLHMSGKRYRWEDESVPIADAPEGLVELMSEGGLSLNGGHDLKPTEDQRNAYRNAKKEGRVRKGERDHFANSMAYELRMASMSFEEAEARMRHWHSKFNQPPGDEFTWESMRGKLTRVWEEVEEPEPTPDYQPDAAGDGQPRESRLITVDELRDRPEPTWRLEKLIPQFGIGQMFGQTYVGKTFVALDLALSVANGLPGWHEHDINLPGSVVYALMEGSFDFVWRVDAWLAAHPGCDASDLFVLEEEELDLGSDESVGRLMFDIEAKAVDDTALIVVDTQGLATPGRNEDAAVDMNLIYSKCKRLAKKLDCFVLLVHHTGWDETRQRGSSAQPQAMDAILNVTTGTITVRKVRAAKAGESMYFALTESDRSVWAMPVSDLTSLAMKLNADEALRQKIVDVVRAQPGISPTGAHAVLGGRKENVMAVINSMIGDQLVNVGSATHRKLTIVDAPAE